MIKGQLRIPENPVSVTNGIDYRYYRGVWTELPDFTNMNPIKSGSVENFSLAPRKRNNLFAFQYTGFINVPTNGEYTFFTTSDDGSKLYIGDGLVVNNDGLHVSREQSGSIGLKAGKHAVRVTFFQLFGSANLQVAYQGPALAKQQIPDLQLYRSTETSFGRVAGEEIAVELEVFPNPANDQFTVRYYSSSDQKVKISIVDITSSTVIEKEVQAVEGFNEEQFNRGSMKSGIYLIHVSATDIREVKKLLLK